MTQCWLAGRDELCGRSLSVDWQTPPTVLHGSKTQWIFRLDVALNADQSVLCVVAVVWVELRRAMIVHRWLGWRRHTEVGLRCMALRRRSMMDHVLRTTELLLHHMMVLPRQVAPGRGIQRTSTLHRGELASCSVRLCHCWSVNHFTDNAVHKPQLKQTVSCLCNVIFILWRMRICSVIPCHVGINFFVEKI